MSSEIVKNAHAAAFSPMPLTQYGPVLQHHAYQNARDQCQSAHHRPASATGRVMSVPIEHPDPAIEPGGIKRL